MALGTVEDIKTNLESARNAQAEVVAREQSKLAQLDAALDALRQDSTVAPVKRQDFKDLGITLASRRVLEARGDGARMSTRELADEIRARGVESKSKNFIPTVYATLANSDVFTRVDGKWTLRRKGDRR